MPARGDGHRQVPAAAPQSQVQAEPSTVCVTDPEPTAPAHSDVPAVAASNSNSGKRKPGIKVSRELFAKAGLRDAEDVMYLTLR